MPSKFNQSGYPHLSLWGAGEAIRDAVQVELSRLAIAAGKSSGVTVQRCASGEVMVKSMDKDNPHASWCGHFGQEVADILNESAPRTGEIQYGRNARIIPESGWCWVLEGLLVAALQKREQYRPPEDFTARQLIESKRTLYQVHALVQEGRISEITAQEFARVWVAGKSEYRFNDALSCLEEALTVRKSGPSLWRRYSWR